MCGLNSYLPDATALRISSSLLAVERRRPTEQDKHDDSDPPDVSLFVVTASKHLWRNIVGSPNYFRHLGCSLEFLCGSEVNQFDAFDVFRFIKKYIFGLDVFVHEIVGMSIAKCFQNLLNDSGAVFF